MIQFEVIRIKPLKEINRTYVICGPTLKGVTYVLLDIEGEKRMRENILKIKIMTKISPNLVRNINLQI